MVLGVVPKMVALAPGAQVVVVAVFRSVVQISNRQHDHHQLEFGPTLDKIYTISKSKAGVDGADGADAKVVVLAASSQIFQVAKTGSVTPSSITFTAAGQNLAGTPVFAVSSGTATLTGSGNSRSLAYASMTTDTATITVTWDGQTDSVTVVKLREGADAYNAILTNEASTVAANSAGVGREFRERRRRDACLPRRQRADIRRGLQRGRSDRA